MNTTARSESFHAVGEQIAATLNDAHMALESYAEGEAGPRGLKRCNELLHSVRGALNVASIYGAGLLTEEMEATCTFMLDNRQSEGGLDEAIEALSRAMVHLPSYVERIMEGGSDIPIALLPLLNDLRAARGKPLLSESTLLLLNGGTRRQKTDADVSRSPSGEDVVAALGRLRPQFQLGLLGWIKGSDSEQNLQRLAKVADRVEQSATADELHQLWWVVGGIIDALSDNSLQPSIALKRLFGQADRELKRLQQKGEQDFVKNPPTELVNNLLYYVAQAGTGGGDRCEAIRAAYNLTGLMTDGSQVEQFRESLSAPSPRLMKTVADAIREDLSRAKDVLDLYVRTGMEDSSELQAQVGLLRKISDTLGVLGLGGLREIVLNHSQQIEQLIQPGAEQSEAVLINLAAALLEVEGRLDQDLIGLVRPKENSNSDVPEPVDTDFHAVTQAVLRECMINLAHIKDTISQVLINPDDRGGFDAVPGQLRGVSAGLMMLGRSRAVEVLQRIEVAIRANLQGSQATQDGARLNRLADAIVSLEYYMETLQAGRKEPVYMLENAERSLRVLEEATVSIVPDTEASGSYTQTLQIDVGSIPDVPPPPTYEKTRIIETPVMAPREGQPDLELLEIFIEEAREEIDAINRHFPAWRDNPADDEALITMRRSFHTLKGSGRMVGAALIGEYAWNIENLLNRILNKTIATRPETIAFLADAVAAVPQLIEQLEAGSPPQANIEELADDAVVFAEGRIAARYEQTAVSADEDDSAADEELELAAEPELAGIDPVLLDILTRETGTHLAAIREYLSELAPIGAAVTEEMHRACHTLHGSITMADVREASGLTDALYQLIEQLFRHHSGLDTEQRDLCSEAANAIEAQVAHLHDPAMQTPDTSDLEARLEALAVEIAEQRDVAEADATLVTEGQFSAEADADAEEELQEAQAEIEQAGGVDLDFGFAEEDEAAEELASDFDAEIAAIFAEEAAEILEAADAELVTLADSGSRAPLAELQRHLHTLKGGARMAGITVMGDFSHELESLLIRVMQGGMAIDEGIVSLLQASLDDLHRMREQVLSGNVRAPGQELMDRLASVVEATMMMPALQEEPDVVETGDDNENAVTADDDAEETPEVEISDIELETESIDIDFGDDDKPLRVPEPEQLGELARDLIRGKAPERPEPLPENLGVAASGEAPQRKEMARVDSAMLEDLLNNAGEISIFHSRLKQQVSSIQFNLDELGSTVQRLQQQLRLLEMETEAQILFKHQNDAVGDEEDFDPLELDRYSTIQQLSRGLSETASDVNSIKDLLQNIAADTETILSQQQRTTSELQDNLMRTRMVPFDQHVPRLQRLVRQQAQESGKQVELVVRGSSGELDRQVLEKMLPPFEHMLRNAVIHGIESTEKRSAAGKSDVARITIRFRREGAHVLIDIADDGTGLDMDAVRRKAVAQGIVEEGQTLSQEELAQLILRSGLSTADKLTQSAGRGIGMDVVVNEISKLGGTLGIASEAGKGCTFTVRLPYTLAITQAFIVRSGSESFALPLPSVEGVVRMSREEFDQRLGQNDPRVEYGGQSYRLRHLGMFLGLGPARLAPDQERVSLILVAAGENSAALIVDETTESREVVVKPIGTLLASIRGIAGATILGDGRIVVILDAGALVRMPVSEQPPVEIVKDEDDDLPPLALVVDDSITMRRVTQRLLERNGMRVLTAKDGVEALEVLRDHRPRIVLLDVEMPRMDGYEFAGRVRSNPATAALPIIMVTSRSGEKHRARAIELGVNDYLGKPYQEHDMLDAIRHLLGEDFNVRH